MLAKQLDFASLQPGDYTISIEGTGGNQYHVWYAKDFTVIAKVPVTGVSLNKTTLALNAGTSETLTATISPSNATNKSVIWMTSNISVATDSNGVVTAVGAGTATITATAGDKTATCVVTVTPKSAYSIGTLYVRDMSVAPLSAIPNGSFLVTIPIKKQLEESDALVILAAYTASGQFRGLLYVSVEDVPLGATVKVTLPVDNSDGSVAHLKAFSVASFDDPVPLGEAAGYYSKRIE